jgi:hypothetical protein
VFTVKRDISLADFSTIKMDAIRSSETSVHTRSTRRYNPEHGIIVVYLLFIYLIHLSTY